MAEASKPHTGSYRTFNDFFVRPLKEGARPIDPDASLLALPADGAISQLGRIAGDQIFQAKRPHLLAAGAAGRHDDLAEKFSRR